MIKFATTTLEQTIRSKLEARQDGGNWLPVNHDDVPPWVGSMAADEVAENDADRGHVQQGGSVWRWRKTSYA